MNNSTRTLGRTTLVAGLAAVALAGCGMMSKSNVANFSGAMNAASEVPPNMTRGSGMAEAWLNRDTNVLKYKITYNGLSGPATAAHFHGPAAAGANAGVVLPFASAASPIEGQATLTPAQAADLVAGKWYANIHTAANPGGEIRGQMLPKM
ncbi:MAG: CHRD domain-containing protein [Pseudomonadota bacterium]